ncbi:dTMP kinase [Sulfurospirillum arcachonense]|uniref:dTMP kinase n=1 Tax=Sulfurospirillum arcachonense TaxID=57666 RepID=UPI0004697171|nr:dTMP kinase [Sulfurospirillum arcachonense]
MYILFEGIDTTGKSTQVELFAKRHKNVVTTKEPGGTQVGTKLREILLESDEKLGFNAELFLFLADRAEHYEKIVQPKLENNYIISDRGMISGISYALANHPELDSNFLIDLNKFALNGNLPDKVVLFQTNYELITSRLGNKQKDTIEKRGIKYLLHVQDLMKSTLNALHVNYLEIDSSNTIEEIYKQIEDFIYG